jgi:hypothetical protein
MLAFGHQIADSSRTGDVETEAEAVFEDRSMEGAEMNATFTTTRFYIK